MSTLPFSLLELNLKSCQDLEPVIKKKCKTYAIAWVNPERKLRTRIDEQGHTNPTWNDKFVFRVDEKTLNSDTTNVNIEIYALGWLKDILVGSVEVPITSLIPQEIRAQNNSTRRFVTLQIRRPSGRPQGILSMGVTLLDNTMKSMPLHSKDYKMDYNDDDLIDDKNGQENERIKGTPRRNNDESHKGKPNQNNKAKPPRPQLRRSNSDRTGLSNRGMTTKAGSMVKGGSLVNGTSCINWDPSVVTGNAGSMVNWGPTVYLGGGGGGGGGGGSVVNDGGSLVISDVGPSASVVAAAVARGLYPTQLKVPQAQPGSSILGDWTIEDSSVEGLKSKIDRWRMELPAMYDQRDYQKVQQTPKKTPRRPQRRTKNGSTPGLFSCIGSAFGCEFTIVCGSNGSRKPKRCDANSNLFSPTELGISNH